MLSGMNSHGYLISAFCRCADKKKNTNEKILHLVITELVVLVLQKPAMIFTDAPSCFQYSYLSLL